LGLRKRVKQLYEIAADVQARALLAGATVRGARRVVVARLADLSIEEAQVLARKLTAGADAATVVALLGLADGDGGKLLFARSGGPAATEPAMGALVKSVMERFGGGGGGPPAAAPGGVPEGPAPPAPPP